MKRFNIATLAATAVALAASVGLWHLMFISPEPWHVMALLFALCTAGFLMLMAVAGFGSYVVTTARLAAERHYRRRHRALPRNPRQQSGHRPAQPRPQRVVVPDPIVPDAVMNTAEHAAFQFLIDEVEPRHYGPDTLGHARHASEQAAR